MQICHELAGVDGRAAIFFASDFDKGDFLATDRVRTRRARANCVWAAAENEALEDLELFKK